MIKGIELEQRLRGKHDPVLIKCMRQLAEDLQSMKQETTQLAQIIDVQSRIIENIVQATDVVFKSAVGSLSKVRGTDTIASEDVDG